ncbi:hypothetical protein G6F65_022955 [Rhizopus arrhizus]|nr:hypothetical protein G6F31_018730 [Rhizopus arrhizus]KAG1242567.1 hypothetical protein G6F65_022955 [Rhizopus arrhizus]
MRGALGCDNARQGRRAVGADVSRNRTWRGQQAVAVWSRGDAGRPADVVGDIVAASGCRGRIGPRLPAGRGRHRRADPASRVHAADAVRCPPAGGSARAARRLVGPATGAGRVQRLRRRSPGPAR